MSLLRNLLILTMVGGLAALALSFRGGDPQASRETASQERGAAESVARYDEAAGEELLDEGAYDEGADDERAGDEAAYDEDADGEEAGDEASLTREIMIRKDASGHFLLKARVEGVAIRFLIDTGASDVVLSPDDARRLHLNGGNLDYSLEYQTANGTVRAAPVVLRDLRIGQLELYELEASVNEAPMGISLLGMTFLERLDSYSVEGDSLILRW